ncbi:MAG TPA: hypothetical protein PL115_04150 [Bacteroidales bacterium]|nr:hypothetical protein [Bacteroidales bacterium]
MHLSAPDREIVSQIVDNERASIQAAAYTIYLQIKPNNKKTMNPREFHKEFADNWETFMKIELEENDGE